MCEKYLQEKRIQSSFGKANFGGCTVGITSKAKIWLEKAKRTPGHPLVLEMSAEMLNMEEVRTFVAEKKVVLAPVFTKKYILFINLLICYNCSITKCLCLFKVVNKYSDLYEFEGNSSYL